MIILMDRPLANDHPEWLASCKWSSVWISLLQMIDRIEWPLANDHPDGSFSKYHPRFPSLFIFSSKDPKPKNSRILGQYTHNLLGLNPYPSQFSFHPQKIWIKGPQNGSDMPSALGLVQLASNYWAGPFWYQKHHLNISYSFHLGFGPLGAVGMLGCMRYSNQSGFTVPGP